MIKRQRDFATNNLNSRQVEILLYGSRLLASDALPGFETEVSQKKAWRLYGAELLETYLSEIRNHGTRPGAWWQAVGQWIPGPVESSLWLLNNGYLFDFELPQIFKFLALYRTAPAGIKSPEFKFRYIQYFNSSVSENDAT